MPDVNMILGSDVFKFLADSFNEEREALIRELIETRDPDEKTFLQGKIAGLNYLNEIAEEEAMDEKDFD